MLLPKIKKIPKNTNGRLAIPALAGLLVVMITTHAGRDSVLDQVRKIWKLGQKREKVSSG